MCRCKIQKQKNKGEKERRINRNKCQRLTGGLTSLNSQARLAQAPDSEQANLNVNKREYERNKMV